MKVVLFDTETDSLMSNSAISINKQPRVIELFALTLDQKGEGAKAKFKELSSYSQLFSTGREIPEDVQKITGISNEMIANAPPFRMYAKEVAGYMESGDRVVAHNLSFDTSIIDFEMQRAGSPPVAWREKICTVEATEYFFGFRLSLTMLHKTLFNEDFPSAHRAEADVRAMARCYMELVKREVI